MVIMGEPNEGDILLKQLLYAYICDIQPTRRYKHRVTTPNSKPPNGKQWSTIHLGVGDQQRPTNTNTSLIQPSGYVNANCRYGETVKNHLFFTNFKSCRIPYLKIIIAMTNIITAYI